MKYCKHYCIDCEKELKNPRAKRCKRCSHLGKHHSDRTKKKMSEASSGINNSQYGKHLSKEIRDKMSEAKKGKNNPNYGNHFSEETKQKIRESQLGKHLSKVTKKKISKATAGKNNSNYIDGRSGCKGNIYSSEFKNLREYIRDKYGRICVECGKIEKDNGCKLPIHHIDYDKENNKEENLIPLCCSCHSKTNFSREDWIQYFKEKFNVKKRIT